MFLDAFLCQTQLFTFAPMEAQTTILVSDHYSKLISLVIAEFSLLDLISRVVGNCVCHLPVGQNMGDCG
jgi:hypothetical protein